MTLGDGRLGPRIVAVVVVLLLGAALPAAAAIERPDVTLDPGLRARLEREETGRDPLVVFVHGETIDAARAAVRHTGLRSLTEWTSIDVVVAAGTRGAVEAVAREPGVTYVEPNTEIAWSTESAREATRADEAIATDWLARAQQQQCERNISRRRGACPVEAGTRFDGAGRSIAVVDSGVDGRHPMFMTPEGRSRVVRNMRVSCPGTSLVQDPETGAEAPEDLCLRPQAGSIQVADVPTNDSDTPTAGGHGTHVAGIAAGRAVSSRGRTLSGVAPGASIVALSTSIAVGVAGANTALDWIARNHKAPCGNRAPIDQCPPITVVNNSYGPSGGGEFRAEQAVVKLQRRLVEAGIVMVWANGNDGGTGAENTSNPPGQDPTPGIISVANYDDFDQGTRAGTIAPSSSRGDRGRAATFPDLAAPGTSITSACRRTLPLCSSGDADPDYGTISGTSMAAPHVAGAVAVLQQALEAGTSRQPPKDRAGPGDVERILEDTALRFAFAGPYVADQVDGESGPRNPNSPTSFDKGHGLLDLAAAVGSVFGASEALPGSNECADPGERPALVDAEGDGAIDATGRTPADDPALDVLAATIEGHPTSLVVTLTIRVKDLAAAPRHRGERWITSFWVGDAFHELDVQRVPGGNTYVRTVDGEGAGQVTFDATRDEVVFDAPSELFTPALVGPVRVDGLTVESLSATAVALALTADTASTPCAGTVDAGLAGPQPDPAPGSGNGRVTRGAGAYEWTGRTPVPANAMPVGDLACPTEGDRRCAHHALEVALDGATSGALRLVVSFASGDDIDVFVYDPRGELVASGEADNRADRTAEEVVEVELRQPGVYRVSVSGWLAPSGGNFRASTTLS